MMPDIQDAPDRDPVEEACELNDAAVESFRAGRAEEAEELFQRALGLLSESEGDDSPDVANILSSLGAVGEHRCEYAGAEGHYARAAAIMETHADSDDEDVRRLRLQTLSDLGRIRRILGRYEEAEPLIKRSIEIAEEYFGPESLETAGALNDLGMLYKFNGRFDEAEPLYRRALSILERLLGPEAVELASIYHNLGGLEHARGRHAAGEPHARRSVELRERALGPEHTDVAADVAALAALLDGQEKFEESEPLYRRALAIFEREYGPEHYEVAVNLNNLAMVLEARDEAEEAEALRGAAG
jgi:tetratricopeptide (TPR) repeat protein